MNVRKKCVKCGTSGVSNFCPNCGEKLRDVADVLYYDRKKAVMNFNRTHKEVFKLAEVAWNEARKKIYSLYPEADDRCNREAILRDPFVYQKILDRIPDAADELYSKLLVVIKDFMATYGTEEE